MAVEDVRELVESSYAAFNSGGVEPWLALWHPDGVYINARTDPDHDVHRGVDAIGRLARSWVDAYPDLRVEPIELRANGNRVFVWIRLSGHGAGSGAPVDLEGAHVWTVEDGKLRRNEEFSDRAEALQAVGLSEQGTHVDS